MGEQWKYSLTSAEASKRLGEFGENKLAEKKKTAGWEIFLRQLASPLVYVLFVACLVSLVVGHVTDAIFILGVVLVNAGLGFYQENKAENALVELKKMIASTVRVVRDGKAFNIDAEKIVPGDIIMLAEGDKVPADGVIVRGFRVWVNEAILTGESMPVGKKEMGREAVKQIIDKLDWEKINNEARMMMGTTVSSGRMTMMVVRTGMRTEMGRLAKIIEDEQESETPLQRRLRTLAKQLALLVLIIVVGVFFLGIARGVELTEILLASLALAVSAIPEGLLISLTVILAVAMQRILKRQAVVRRLVAAETLGTVTTICVDKTGTLTYGKMKVVHEEVIDLNRSVTAAVLANGLTDPLEIAMWDWAQGRDHFDPQRILESEGRVDVIPFLPKERFQAALTQKGEIWVTGAPELLLKRSEINEADKEKWMEKIKKDAEEGLRLVGLGYRFKSTSKVKIEINEIEKLEFLGYLALSDPIRDGVRDALMQAQSAGIKVKVITGDYRLTAEKVLEQAGIIIDEPQSQILEGEELAKISAADLKLRIQKIKLFARVTPDQKYRIVQALQANGEVVAMTGDGVNDAPALKKADIGVVVGEASDVSKETADIVLLDSNFQTILAAVEEGRGAFDNLKKVITYLLSDTFEEITFVVGCLLLELPLPLTAIQILWINLISDGFPALALTVDPKRKGVLREGPISFASPLINLQMKITILTVSVVSGLIALGAFVWIFDRGDTLGAKSIGFAVLGVNSLLYVYSCRSLAKPVWEERFGSNKWLAGAVALGLLIFILPFITAWGQDLFGVRNLRLDEWVVVVGLGAISIGTIEIIKHIFGGRKTANLHN